MSIRYRINGQWVTPSHIRKVYESSFIESGEIFTHYLGAYMRLELVETKIKIERDHVGIKTQLKGKLSKYPRINPDVRLPVKAIISLIPDFSIIGLDLDYYLTTQAAHEFSEGPYRFIRAKIFNLDIKDKKVATFFRIVSESFAEIFKSLYCDVKGLEFKPHPVRGIITKRHLAPNPVYEYAHDYSMKYKNKSLRFKARLLQALLFQKHEPIVVKKDPFKAVEDAIENEFKRAEKYAKG